MKNYAVLPTRSASVPGRSRLIAGCGLPLAGSLLLLACASPKPVIYPNTHYENVGNEAAQNDIRECSELAESAGAEPSHGKAAATAKRTAVGGASGAVGGAIVGSPGIGAAIGAASSASASILSSVLGSKPPSPTYMRFVDRCLRERGYEPMGWE